MRSSEYFHQEFLFLRFSTEYRDGWLPNLGFGGVTAEAADYHGRVPVHIPWLLISVPRKRAVQMPWFFITVPGMCRGIRLPRRKRSLQMPGLLIAVPRMPWRPSTGEACHTNAVIARNRTMIYRSIIILYRGQPCNFQGLYPKNGVDIYLDFEGMISKYMTFE